MTWTRDISKYYQLLRIASAGSKALFTASILTNLLIAQLPAVLAYTSKTIIDSLVAANTTSRVPILLGCLYLVLLLVQYIGQVVLVHVNETLTETSSRNIHLEIIKSAIRLEGLYYFENPDFHDRRSLLERDALYIPMNLLRFLTDLGSIAVTTLGMVVLLFGLHPLIPLLIILAGIPDVLTQKRAHRMVYEGIKETTHEERIKNYYYAVPLTEEHAKEVRIYNLAGFFVAKHRASVKRILDIVLPIRRRQVRRSVLTHLLVSVGNVLPFLWTVGQAVNGRISVGQLVMFMTAIVVIQQQMARAAQTLAGHQDVGFLMKELIAWFEMKPDLSLPKESERLTRRHQLPPRVEVSNLWFKYPGSETEILKGLDLEIPKGKSLAIVGRNGSGKTTLVKLLCRLYDPQEGSICYDGVDIRLFNLDDLRNSIGIIFQDFIRYDLSIRENITLGKAVNGTPFNPMHQAAITAGAEDFIKPFPDEYETLLGHQFPGGVEISGGQWQRLALARAFYRDAGLLVLDEPTASLDIATEARIYAHFKTMTEGRTSLLISHRLSTVRIADHIAVIEDGRVVELGDHESLMGLHGIYNEMFIMQAERFKLNNSLQETSLSASL
jgi:ATP-binding cassette subfamily B protein